MSRSADAARLGSAPRSCSVNGAKSRSQRPQRGRPGERGCLSATGPERIESSRTEPTRTDLRTRGGMAAFPGTFQERVTWCSRTVLRWTNLRWTRSFSLFLLLLLLSLTHTHGHMCAHFIRAHAHGENVCFFFMCGRRKTQKFNKNLFCSLFPWTSILNITKIK